MNIFILDETIEGAVQALCDKHVVKMVLETAQLLDGQFPEGAGQYKRTHYNHPCSKWARQTIDNYSWLVDYGIALCKEYTFRYGRRHKCETVIHWCGAHRYRSFEFEQPEHDGMTPFAICVPDEHKVEDDAVASYRRYYIAEKAYMATWNKNRPAPDWWVLSSLPTSPANLTR